jgi:hypothetical protein
MALKLNSRFQILMGVGNDLVVPQLTSGQELTGEYISKIFTQRTVWLVPSEKLKCNVSCTKQVQ